MSNTKIDEKIKRVIGGHAMLPKGCAVVAGLSGGADSVALTHFLFTHREEYGITLIAAHINHGLRGEAASKDEALAAGFCAKLGVDFRVCHEDVAALAKKDGLGLEDCGRRVRYAFFRSLLTPGGRIATAHTMSDSAETMLLNLTRGAGARGLSGIPPVRGEIVRPLLGITREEVEEYCTLYGLAFAQDETNQSRDFARNRIRLDVSPVLKTLNPSFEESAARAAESLAADDALLRAMAERILQKSEKAGGWRLKPLQATPEPVLSRALMLALEQAGAPRFTALNIRQAMSTVKNGGAVTVAGGIQITARGNTLCVLPQKEEPSDWETPLLLPKTTLPDGRVLEIGVAEQSQTENPQKFHNLLFNNRLDYDTIKYSVCVRTRKSGDFFHPAGRGVGKTLKKLMNEAGVPAHLRGRLLVLAKGDEPIWVEGFGPCEAARPRPGNTVAQITIRETQE